MPKRCSGSCALSRAHRPVQAAYFTMCLRPPRQRRLRRQLFYPLGQWGAQLPRPWAQLALTVPILATVVPPRAVGRGASRVTRRCLRCACACRRYVIGIQLGSLFLRDTGVDLSTYIICIYLAARCASVIAILGMNSRVLYGHHPGGGTRHIRGRSDFSRFDPRPERPHFSST